MPLITTGSAAEQSTQLVIPSAPVPIVPQE
jgi:hypothetical protein